ncbi:hypothetical protein D3C81_1430210 [compost metagenome]
MHGGGTRHDDAVAAALDAPRQYADEQAVLAGSFERNTVERTWEIGHGAEVEFAGDHLVGQRRAAGEVLPLHVVLRVLVGAVVGQIFVEQTEFTNQQTASGAIDGGVLGADGDADGFGRGRQSERSQYQTGDCCTQHECFPSNHLFEFVSAAIRARWETRGFR